MPSIGIAAANPHINVEEQDPKEVLIPKRGEERDEEGMKMPLKEEIPECAFESELMHLFS